MDLPKVSIEAMFGGHTLEVLAPYVTIAPTIRIGLWGVTGYITTDPENIRILLSERFENYGLGTRRMAALPLLREGIFSQDGQAWKPSQDIIWRQFVRVQQQSLEAFTPPVNELVSALAQATAGGKIVDLMPAFYEFTLSTTTETRRTLQEMQLLRRTEELPSSCSSAQTGSSPKAPCPRRRDTQSMSVAFVIIGTIAYGFIKVIPIVSSPFTTKPEDIGLSVGALEAIHGPARAIATAIYLSILINKDTTLSAEKIPVAVLNAILS
jgi:hypothetical protein